MITASAIESDSFGIVSSRAKSSLLELARPQVARERRREATLAHPLQLVARLLLDLVDRRPGDALRLELRAEEDDRVARPPLVELAVGPVRARVAPRVPHEPVRDRLQEERA